MSDTVDIQSITDLHRLTTFRWHRQAEPNNDYSGFLRLVCEQHQCNYLLWHEEDIARDPSVTDAEMARVKRSIDRLNQRRNDRIEQLDVALQQLVEQAGVTPGPKAKWNTETPGSAIDRLSILALRIYHMEEQAERPDVDENHRRMAQGKLAVLYQQHRDLAKALAELTHAIFAGKRVLKIYRQFKMYNDPALNPRIYTARRRAAG